MEAVNQSPAADDTMEIEVYLEIFAWDFKPSLLLPAVPFSKEELHRFALHHDFAVFAHLTATQLTSRPAQLHNRFHTCPASEAPD